jgi:prepilin-type N-terminal cleavage/methylation domain-containing protein
MNKEIFIPKRGRKARNGFSLAEMLITTAIISILASIAYPNYVNSNNKARQSEVKATIQAIPPIIGAYIDATGEAPKTWDDLSTIAAVMTNNGPATGDLTSLITLPNSIYDLSIEGPTESIYTLKATRVFDRLNASQEIEEDDREDEQYKYAITSCFNISNGASDLLAGNLSDIENELNCG